MPFGPLLVVTFGHWDKGLQSADIWSARLKQPNKGSLQHAA